MNNITHLMVIDDEPIVGKRLKKFFEKVGYSVEVFTDSLDAIKELEKNHFDIIITDFKMEGIDGMKILETAKQINPNIKVIIITGFGSKATAKKLLDRGAFDFITKLFKINGLKQIIRKAEMELRY